MGEHGWVTVRHLCGCEVDHYFDVGYAVRLGLVGRQACDSRKLAKLEERWQGEYCKTCYRRRFRPARNKRGPRCPACGAGLTRDMIADGAVYCDNCAEVDELN